MKDTDNGTLTRPPLILAKRDCLNEGSHAIDDEGHDQETGEDSK